MGPRNHFMLAWGSHAQPPLGMGPTFPEQGSSGAAPVLAGYFFFCNTRMGRLLIFFQKVKLSDY
jgi:hypothetical protein